MAAVADELKDLPWEQAIEKLTAVDPVYAKTLAVNDWCVNPEKERK
jgi:hypothetical protein